MKKILLSSLLVIYLLNSFAQKDCYEFERKGFDAYNKKDYQSSLHHFEALIDCEQRINNFYNAACAATLTGDTKKGFLYLKKAIDYGFLDSSHMNVDQDLEALRKSPDWKKVNGWFKSVRDKLEKELSGIHDGCPASSVIPYLENQHWGYLDKNTNKRLTNPIFNSASFVGKTGEVQFGEYILRFDCTGKIVHTQFLPSGMVNRVKQWNNPETKVDSTIKSGFSRKGKMTYYAPSYQEFIFFKGNDKDLYAAVLMNNAWSLIDSTGKFLLTGFKNLSFYNYGPDSDYFPDYDLSGSYYFFYKDSLGKAGILDPELEPVVTDLNEVTMPTGNGFDGFYLDLVRDHIYIKKNGKWGIWHAYKRDWIVQPQYDDILLTERTYDGNFEDYYRSGNTIDLYFLVQLGTRQFFIDLKNKRYIPR